MIASGIIYIFTSYILYTFDEHSGVLFSEGREAIHIMSLSLVFLSQAVLFFMYYLMIDEQLLALIVGLLKDLVCPVACAVLFGLFFPEDDDFCGWGWLFRRL